ncbi:TetR/AcrR family transcriptional regulator [Promicromonospora citrea]|uniref:TetR family transcriptional regulator n=1 Tax=Promicromonospora citrea TaxID=43677 RepID=A0A8H9GEQ2_9MICO|nr:TetR/AcrR family transcriptional regulator [Promicromonospora citrea]NNH52189.1 TetR/AcrR family transcriptional regulator [Promicromonospora citrea]GGM14301.1 TetR family transcriptional regulator [Promicromonospora citrea]
MSTTTPERPPADADGTAKRSVRDRILDAASELFYARGIHATSADKIIELSGVTKVTFYRYFRTKDVLVVAYLERQAAWERGALDGLRRSSGDDAQALRRFAAAIGAESCKPGFRGCAFINAAAEYPDPEGPVRKVVAQHRGWYRATFAGMLGRIGVNDPARAADEVMMLRDGAMVAGSLDEPSRVGGALERAIFAVIDASRATRTAG